MFLKSIEIRGFKSFADKTELTFKKGITAVVGPNGSGKSNISDAVKWVLGEQSVRNLRGDKMEDVIFAGTQFRKPVGLAQVSLTLDNCDCELDIDYSNVTISRRLYRSGESEYLINNTSCRLKDVQQLFMDTGIGKEGYSIIGQGKIDAILSGKTEERRKLIEEAAGIVKFKSRKEESEKRLAGTEQNLVRIKDILSTYEERLEPLRGESEKAKSFLKFFEQLKSKEVSLIIDSVNKIQGRIKSLGDECSKLSLESGTLAESKNQLKKDVEHWNTESEKFENRNQEEKQLYYNNKLVYQNNESEINILNERIENLSKTIHKLSKDSEGINEKLLGINKNINELESSLSSTINTQLEIEEKIKIKENIIKEIQENISNQSDEANYLKEKEQSINDKVQEITNNLLILKNNIDNYRVRINSLKNSIVDLENLIETNMTTKTMLQGKGFQFKNNIDNLESKIKYNEKLVNENKNVLEANKVVMKNCSFKISKTEAHLNVLTTLEKKHEGYNKSVKNLMEHINGGKVSGINECFVLGEIIKVEKDLEVAIEIALGGNISHIVTKDEAVAKTLISYLKSSNLGRATFLPLNIIKGRMLIVDNETKNHPGFLGVASELISYDKKFSEVMAFILGKTILCKDMDSALQISKKNNYKFKVVTLSGEVINPGGSLTGGSIYSKTSSIIGRKREMQELAKELEILKKDLIISLEKIDKNKFCILNLEEENLIFKDQVHFENIEFAKIDANINAIEYETLRLKDNLVLLEAEMVSELRKVELDNEEIKEKNIYIAKATTEINEMRQKITDLDMKLKDRLIEIENTKESIMDGKIKKAQVDEVINNKTSEILRLKVEIRVYNEKITLLSQEIEEAIGNKKLSEDIIQAAQEKVKDTLTLLEKMEKGFEDSEVERIRIKEKIRICKDQFDSISLLLEKNEKDLYKCELALAKVGMEKDTYYEKLNEDFHITYAEALEFESQIDDVDKLKKEIIVLKNSISMLGTVNVGAIEEYKEVNEKFTFMDDQKEDLISAKNELLTVISEMTEKMKEIFAENFVILRQNFQETFTELFKGGSADLILTEGDELSGKIDINVQPPGKKLQNINLMSGGEKVLSAIALLFAILKMKPTPFCILDEIEAALDDANVVRYAEFLKKFSDEVQFIIITHRKGTMEASDVLYGVTMEEKGVSKIVSVDFNR